VHLRPHLRLLFQNLIARGCPATECFSYDTRFGARPFGRPIENEIARVLADEVLFGKLAKGGKVKVDLAERSWCLTTVTIHGNRRSRVIFDPVFCR
jgi:ATP-dependent Clp protease ATP-binding subunit ClpA